MKINFKIIFQPRGLMISFVIKKLFAPVLLPGGVYILNFAAGGI